MRPVQAATRQNDAKSDYRWILAGNCLRDFSGAACTTAGLMLRRHMKVEEIAEAIAELPPDQLAPLPPLVHRFRGEDTQTTPRIVSTASQT